MIGVGCEAKQLAWDMEGWQGHPALLEHPGGGAVKDTMYQHFSQTSRAGSQPWPTGSATHSLRDPRQVLSPEKTLSLLLEKMCCLAGFSGFCHPWGEIQWEQGCPHPPDPKHPPWPKSSPEFSAHYSVQRGAMTRLMNELPRPEVSPDRTEAHCSL